MLPALEPRQRRGFPSTISLESEDSQGRDRHGRRRVRRFRQSEDGENNAPSPRKEVVDDASSPCEGVAGDASPTREEVNSDGPPKGDPPQATGYLQPEKHESSGSDHGDHDEVPTPQPKLPPSETLLRLLRGILIENAWATMPAEARNCLGLPNRLGPLKTTVFSDAVQEASIRREKHARAKTEALTTAQASLEKIDSSAHL